MVAGRVCGSGASVGQVIPSRSGGPAALADVVVVVVVASVLTACAGSSDSTTLSPAGERGRNVADRVGCSACHGGADGDATVGPSWVGSWGTEMRLDDGRLVLFDDDFVTASVRTPDIARREGNWIHMPAFASDQVSDDELTDLVAYLRDLGGRP